ncbi:MAG TPA: MarR family winged helix-turn-helix transcriptional regulator [Acidimicrobiia bacterium]
MSDAGELQAENLLGALCLAIDDRMRDALTDAAGQAASAGVALSALHHFLGSPTIELLRQVLGLTHSGTVRLVDRLEAVGYVRRGPAPDGRATTVSLTAAGRRAATRVTAGRRAVLRDALGALSPTERRRFGELAGRVLAGMVRPAGATRWMCRLCDTAACGRAQGRCPVATAAGLRPAPSG